MKARQSLKGVDDFSHEVPELVHLARLALSARPQDVQLYIRRLSKKLRASNPEVAQSLVKLLQEAPTRASPLRDAEAASVPVDFDSRLQLVRLEQVRELEVEPVYAPKVQEALGQIVRERQQMDALHAAGLEPSRSALLVGMPGVGKSLAARWLSRELNLPLLILDLAAVMSSFLGRTGNNVRNVLDYAKSTSCILLLDEFDAIAKRRDDSTEVGELKRLVTVLLQEIDDWPPTSLLLAATNHPDLLDPAVWRRFDIVVEFEMPSEATTAVAVRRFLGELGTKQRGIADVLSLALHGGSFSDIQRLILRLRRAAALRGGEVSRLVEETVRGQVDRLSKGRRTELAAALVASGAVSQRRAYELTGVSRDTIRRRTTARGEARS
jgi:SpoVK/Ycf46/Vps4 family AAA+-type ATPase